MCHELQPRPGVESFAYANLIDVSAVIPFAGMLTEWALFVSQVCVCFVCVSVCLCVCVSLCVCTLCQPDRCVDWPRPIYVYTSIY